MKPASRSNSQKTHSKMCASQLGPSSSYINTTNQISLALLHTAWIISKLTEGQRMSDKLTLW